MCLWGRFPWATSQALCQPAFISAQQNRPSLAFLCMSVKTRINRHSSFISTNSWNKIIQVKLVLWGRILPILVSNLSRGKVKGSVMGVVFGWIWRAASRRWDIKQGRRGLMMALINWVNWECKKRYKLVKRALSKVLWAFSPSRSCRAAQLPQLCVCAALLLLDFPFSFLFSFSLLFFLNFLLFF